MGVAAWMHGGCSLVLHPWQVEERDDIQSDLEAAEMKRRQMVHGERELEP